MRITMIHGFNATPNDHFYPWLAQKLRDAGHDVRVPELPFRTGEIPEFPALMQIMQEKVGILDEDDILLGHSLGAVLAVRYLENVELKGFPRACVLVAAPWYVRRPEFQSLFMTDLDYDVVPWKVREYVVVHSPDDEAVPFEHAQKWTDMLKARLVDIPGNDHYMGPEYPILFETMQDIATRSVEYAPGKSLPDEFSAT